MAESPLIVYLDQFQWIDLARAYYGRVNATQAARQILPKIMEAVERGRAIFPLSLFTLVETEKRSDQESRERLAEFSMYKKNIATRNTIPANKAANLLNDVCRGAGREPFSAVTGLISCR